VEGDPLHKAGEYFLSRWFKNGLHTVWKPRVNSSGRDAADVPVRLPLVPIRLTDDVSESCEPLTGGRYFRQASSRCKAAVWESRSPKISLASSTPRN
jgi:hypothetical protein